MSVVGCSNVICGVGNQCGAFNVLNQPTSASHFCGVVVVAVTTAAANVEWKNGFLCL